MGAASSIGRGMPEALSLRTQNQRVTPMDDITVTTIRRTKSASDYQFEIVEEGEGKEDLSISFGYKCKQQQQQEGTSDEDLSSTSKHSNTSTDTAAMVDSPTAMKLIGKKSSSFSCLSGAALSANATLANTALGNGFIEEILPSLDSPRVFRKLVSAGSISKLEAHKLSPSGEISAHSGLSLLSPTLREDSPESHPGPLWSPPCQVESGIFADASDLQTAGGAAGEDRVQAVCSEENGWLFCGIYDGFNGRDAADFLAGTFYESVAMRLRLTEWHLQRESESKNDFAHFNTIDEIPSTLPPEYLESSKEEFKGPATEGEFLVSNKRQNSNDLSVSVSIKRQNSIEEWELSAEENQLQGVMQGLEGAFVQTESDFLEMVEQEMDERPELVMVGSCVLAVLLHGDHLFTLNVGDSRAVLATTQPPENSIACERVEVGGLWAVQMTESHVVDNPDERRRIISEHLDDPTAVSGGRLKGKLKVTRAFGAGYMKHAKMNNALMGMLRIKNLSSPPYLGVVPCVSAHKVSGDDSFVVLGSDGLFDFFTNAEVVSLVHNFVMENPTGDTSKYMLDQLLIRAAENAGMSVEQLKGIPIGRRRKYHDDVTVIVISLGDQFPTSTASTVM